jgi:hypothetical protein
MIEGPKSTRQPTKIRRRKRSRGLTVGKNKNETPKAMLVVEQEGLVYDGMLANRNIEAS